MAIPSAFLEPFTCQSLNQIRHILSTTRPPKSVSYDTSSGQYLYKYDVDRIRDQNARKLAKGKGASSSPERKPGDRPRDAAVLLPLMNFRRSEMGQGGRVWKGKGKGREVELGDIVPGILLEVRAGNMRMHAGEAR